MSMMNTHTETQLGTLARLALGIGAGYLVSKGKLDPTQVESIVGAVTVLGTGFWGYYKNTKK